MKPPTSGVRSCPFYRLSLIKGELREVGNSLCGLDPGKKCKYGNQLAIWRTCDKRTSQTYNTIRENKNLKIVLWDGSSFSLNEWMRIMDLDFR
jgi:hypothetical protein